MAQEKKNEKSNENANFRITQELLRSTRPNPYGSKTHAIVTGDTTQAEEDPEDLAE